MVCKDVGALAQAGSVIMPHRRTACCRYYIAPFESNTVRCVFRGLTREPVFAEAQGLRHIRPCRSCSARALHKTSSQVNLSGSSFDTLLAAYTGTAVKALTPVASNDNCTSGGSPSGASCIDFVVMQGMVYSLQVDGVNGANGNVSIAVAFVWVTPSNDAFSAAMPVTTLPAMGTTLGATLETGEPQAMTGVGASGSVWFQFVPTGYGRADVRVCVLRH
jgi:hypothetical protein